LIVYFLELVFINPPVKSSVFMGFRDALLKQPPSFVKKKAYQLHAQLGEGTFGKVLRATWNPSLVPSYSVETQALGTKDVALKVISKKKVKGNEALVWGGGSRLSWRRKKTSSPQYLLFMLNLLCSFIEMDVLKGLDHPNIVSNPTFG
jgi:serine/threonine protein kinase